MPGLTTVSLFSGIGGIDLALEQLGVETRSFCDWEPFCQRVLSTRWPDVKVYGDVCELSAETLRKDMVVADGEQITILTGGFPCFAAGTMVLTRVGYKPIEEVVVGDEVLTHLGRWRRVLKTMETPDVPTVTLKALGTQSLRTTADHPFWARRHRRQWRNKPTRGWDLVHDEPAMTRASDLAGLRVAQVLPVINHIVPESLDFYWLAGKYLADGWTTVSNGKERVVISATPGESEEVQLRLSLLGYKSCTDLESDSVWKVIVTRSELCNKLRSLGKYADGKTVPGSYMELPQEEAKAFCQGYFGGDGYPTEGGWRATTINKGIAYGIAIMVQRAYGMPCTISLHNVPPKKVIEGREVNQRPFYTVAYRGRSRESYLDDQGLWRTVKSVRESGSCTVYNLEVEEDHTYIVDGCVVSNCQPASVAGKRKGKEDARYLWPEMFRLVQELQPQFMLGENVRGIFTVNGGDIFGDIIRDLTQEGYTVGWSCHAASDAGAAHKRERVFFFAFRKGEELSKVAKQIASDQIAGWLSFNLWPAAPGYVQYEFEPPRVSPHTKTRNARLKALGNAVVPHQAFPIAAALLSHGDATHLDFSNLSDEWKELCVMSRAAEGRLALIENCFGIVSAAMKGSKSGKITAHLNSAGQWTAGKPSLFELPASGVIKWPKTGYVSDGLCISHEYAQKASPRVRDQFPDVRVDEPSAQLSLAEEEFWRTPQANEAGARVDTLYDSDGNPATTGRRAYRLQPNGQLVLQSVTINQQVEMWERRQSAALWATPQAETTAGELPQFLVNDKGEAPAPGEKLYRSDSGRAVQTALTTQVKLWPGSWPTPTAQDGKNANGQSQEKRNSPPLNALVRMLQDQDTLNMNEWPTPRASGHEALETYSKRKSYTAGMPLSAAVGVYDVKSISANGLWPTPAATTPNDGEAVDTWLARREEVKLKLQNGNGAGMPLAIAVQVAATPEEKVQKTPRLNPNWTELLMGFPIEWTDVLYEKGKAVQEEDDAE